MLASHSFFNYRQFLFPQNFVWQIVKKITTGDFLCLWLDYILRTSPGKCGSELLWPFRHLLLSGSAVDTWLVHSNLAGSPSFPTIILKLSNTCVYDFSLRNVKVGTSKGKDYSDIRILIVVNLFS